MNKIKTEVEILQNLIKNNTNSTFVKENSILEWACPVLSFGDLEKAKIATLGLNPSDKEFVDNYGNELSGINQRFPTLKSLKLNSWNELKKNHLEDIVYAYHHYFSQNPYDGWFKKLDYIISGTGLSYYFPSSKAVHLDLTPYCTHIKWSDLKNTQKAQLLKNSALFLSELLMISKIEILVLNGQTVVDNFEKIAKVKFNKVRMPLWDLPRKTNLVPGYSYSGAINCICDYNLERDIMVLGFNHNIQSSYGITTQIQNEIRSWITNKIITSL